MTNLMKAETYKLMRNRTFWVLIASMIGLSALLHCLILTDWWLMSGTEFDNVGLSEMNAFTFFTMPLVFNLIVSTLAGFYISTEFSQSGVIKNQIMSGNKRTDRKSTRLNSSHVSISYAVFCLKKKKNKM